MQTEHTKGPWTARNHDASVSGEVRDESGFWVARVHFRDGETAASPECVANTKLIAAAPDLLEALQDLTAQIAVDDEADCLQLLPESNEFKAALAAIAKAEGA